MQDEHYSPRSKKISHYTSSLGSLETVSEEPESEQHEPEETGEPEGAFALERVEHETGGAFGPKGASSEELEPEKAFVSQSEAGESGEDSSDDESEPELDQGGQSGAHQEVPAAVRNLYDSFTVVPQSITQSRMRSGRDATSLQATSIICHPSRPRSAKHRRSRNGQIGSARGKAKRTGNSRARY